MSDPKPLSAELERRLFEAEAKAAACDVGKIDELRAALAEAVELLSRCAHAEGCSWDPSQWNDGPTPCDCGYDAFLKKHDRLETETGNRDDT